ncbi:hypothetical protein K501DRAFT_252215 [Backusella circina FSU 941]|nr:hypothetical protein K501DRAFT_252215 [Backusella circina FSU 941]
MQWRALIMLLSGVFMVYIANRLQEVPHPHPAKIFTSFHTFLAHKPNEIIITTTESHVYSTSIWFEWPEKDETCRLTGIDRLKSGVVGYVRQVKRPISTLLTNDEFKDEDWIFCFDHYLKGHISRISTLPDESSLQFATLYHVVSGENTQHYVRVYYIIEEGVFEYKDILLPGSTWIESFSLENDTIMFARDPDRYRFRTVPIPIDFMDAPHSSNAEIVTFNISETGLPTMRWHQPASTEKHLSIVSRLYSPNDKIFRSFLFDIHKTAASFYINVTIADGIRNELTQLDMLRDEAPKTTWKIRDRGDSEYRVYDESTEYVGFNDISNYHHERGRLHMPKPGFTRSVGTKTIIFPYIKNKFLTLDYTDEIDILKSIDGEREHLYESPETGKYIPEYYYWQQDAAPDSEIFGMQVNEQGTLLAVWTEYNYIYIYKRDNIQSTNNNTIPQHDHQHEHKKKFSISIMNTLDKWFDSVLTDPLDESEKDKLNKLPGKWEEYMTIEPVQGDIGSTPIGSVMFWTDRNSTNTTNYLFVGLKNGDINSYSLNLTEKEKEINIWTFATERWDMLIAMSMIIFVFVYNEYNNPI